MLKLADVKKGDVLYDLGSGDGRMVITAAKLYGVKGTGIDIDPKRIQEANENAKKGRRAAWCASSIRTCSNPTSATLPL